MSADPESHIQAIEILEDIRKVLRITAKWEGDLGRGEKHAIAIGLVDLLKEHFIYSSRTLDRLDKIIELMEYQRDR